MVPQELSVAEESTSRTAESDGLIVGVPQTTDSPFLYFKDP